ncbi:protein required for hyphal anastomosis (ham-2) [Diplodia corticola]|uniref:Protein required for hyphal anastomosis (Ham-2) n=1 Tax=Diplodia corticola TaxID=236234 RepID=A0A1J9QKU5_9PEZI|nr:protein required for hyphal anastomosis (ham-2) [Diplodia corticola]OJD29089.1 protein required for hyphal anastomosis (ham-2) [Diplodia corticola]
MDPSAADLPVADPAEAAQDIAPLVPVGVDEADMMALPPDPATDPQADETVVQPGPDAPEQQNLDGTKSQSSADGVPLPKRPGLKRDKSAPAPQRLPPPAPPAPPLDPGHQPTDSLSLMQLKKLVTDMPKAEPTPYAFEYEDAASFEVEVEEWFSYSVEEQAMLLKAQSSFVEEWVALEDGTLSNLAAYEQGEMEWIKADPALRDQLTRKLVSSLAQTDNKEMRVRSLEALVYIALGCWHETSGLEKTQPSASAAEGEQEPSSPANAAGKPSSYVKSEVQIDWIRNGVQMIYECDGIHPIYDVARAACLREFATDVVEQEIAPQEDKESDRRELWCSLTLMHMFYEIARTEQRPSRLHDTLTHLDPDVVVFMIEIITSLRWDDSIGPPLHKILLLTWKAMLVNFGGLKEVEELKSTFRDPKEETADNRGQPVITASPLDYHVFRQEISSKYPAYNPPQPLFPLEPENNSILPPLKKNPSTIPEANSFGPGISSVGSGTSILHQPVHIATPAPSPPPSPAGPGGKGGKKQNYQTNQLFPFLYPPLDESSNNLGGKGSTDLQDLLVGRKWEGSDIPASIIEAAELFAKRMRATRPMKQLWEERVLFMKYERGWTGSDDTDIDAFDLNGKLEGLMLKKDKIEDRVAAKLDQIEKFYATVLPHLQSLVIVLLRTFLSHLATLALQNSSPNAMSGGGFQDNQGSNPANKSDGGLNGTLPDISNIPLEDLDRMRMEEIQDKAASGILILLLKWFKLSHVLKMEYLTQLLVDSNYIPLTLKLLQLQEIEKVINYRCDREDLSFFTFCYTHSREGAKDPGLTTDAPPAEADDSPDEAAPPPSIKRRRSDDLLADEHQDLADDSAAAGNDGPSSSSPNNPNNPSNATPGLPEVDELGMPLNQLPLEPITTFSWRNFFSNINLLRIMQKVCKEKAHRNLMLVQYKSSQYLRKSLKIPQPQLRLYTLKLFKNQVPYCGRKWRQSNMRVITAVYLHCRPELRDDWLAGSDVDADVDESVPLEQALRALTHWFNLKRWPERLGAERGVLDREQDFFRRELEKMGWSVGGGGGPLDDGGQMQQQHQQQQQHGGMGMGMGMGMGQGAWMGEPQSAVAPGQGQDVDVQWEGAGDGGGGGGGGGAGQWQGY